MSRNILHTAEREFIRAALALLKPQPHWECFDLAIVPASSCCPWQPFSICKSMLKEPNPVPLCDCHHQVISVREMERKVTADPDWANERGWQGLSNRSGLIKYEILPISRNCQQNIWSKVVSVGEKNYVDHQHPCNQDTHLYLPVNHTAYNSDNWNTEGMDYVWILSFSDKKLPSANVH